MNPPSPYSPDRSLLLAVLILTGGLLSVGGSIYLLSVLAEEISYRRQVPLAREQDNRGLPPPGRAPRARWSSRPISSRLFREGEDSSPVRKRGDVPAWRDATPNGTQTSGSLGEAYDLDVDLGHAQLEGPSPAGGAFPGRGASVGSRSEPESRDAPLSVDLGGEVDAGTGSPPAWRTEIRELNGSLRALGGALAHLDRTRREAATSRGHRGALEAKTNPSSDESASEPNPPGTPEQVPIGGAGWLAAAGAAYAVDRLRRHSADASSEEK